jgi:hypothetical protein
MNYSPVISIPKLAGNPQVTSAQSGPFQAFFNANADIFLVVIDISAIKVSEAVYNSLRDCF